MTIVIGPGGIAFAIFQDKKKGAKAPFFLLYIITIR